MKSAQEDFFDKVYDDTYSKVLKYVVVRCRNYVDVQDIVQNIYMDFYMRYQKYGRFHFLSVDKYIFRIARDEMSKYYKNCTAVSQNISIDDEENISLIDEHFLMEDIVCDSCRKEEIWDFVRRKDTMTFKICTLYFLYDYKLSQIAQELGVSESVVKNKLYRAINELKRKFDKEDF